MIFQNLGVGGVHLPPPALTIFCLDLNSFAYLKSQLGVIFL